MSEGLPLTLHVTPCANGETFEYRLFAGKRQIGHSAFLRGEDQKLVALRRIILEPQSR